MFPDGEELSSPTYDINIIDYKIEIQNGLLIYTITGYSAVANKKDCTLKYDAGGDTGVEETTNENGEVTNSVSQMGYKLVHAVATGKIDNTIFEYFQISQL